MKKICGIEVREIQLEILDYMHSFCEANNINYTLAFGTLIGAIRHKGYIPWDDDIDIAMPYPDYKRFLEIFNINNEKFKVIDVETDDRFPYIMAKIEKKKTLILEPGVTYKFGVNIDIFPIYGMPDNPTKQLKHFYKMKKYQKKVFYRLIPFDKKRKWYKNIILALIKLFLLPYNFYKLRQLAKKFPYEESNNVKITSFEMKKPSVFPKEYFDNRILAEFEGKNYYIPTNYDIILKDIYGDYMKFPPEEKRVSHHSYQAFIIND